MQTGTPSGFRDILPTEAVARERISDQVRACFASHGYLPVETPLLEDKVRFGIYAHELMSGISHAGDVDAAIEGFKERYSLADDELETLVRLARMAVGHPVASRFFAPGTRVANEVSLLADGNLGRPDRVVFAEGETFVVDFKTGTPVPQNVVQVRGYCKAIAAMGYPAVSGWLVYLHPEGVEVVPVE